LDNSGVPVEIACESHQTCTTDMLAYKGILLRGLACTAVLAPYTFAPSFATAATAAAKVCDEKTGECGFVWTEAKDDGSHGVGQQLNALSAFSVLLAGHIVAGSTTGGSGTGASTTTSGTPGGTTTPSTKPTNGAAVNGAGVGSLLGGLLLLAAFFV
jgi:mannan endo-1,6-alpha-mannosidase